MSDDSPTCQKWAVTTEGPYGLAANICERTDTVQADYVLLERDGALIFRNSGDQPNKLVAVYAPTRWSKVVRVEPKAEQPSYCVQVHDASFHVHDIDSAMAKLKAMEAKRRGRG